MTSTGWCTELPLPFGYRSSPYLRGPAGAVYLSQRNGSALRVAFRLRPRPAPA